MPKQYEKRDAEFDTWWENYHRDEEPGLKAGIRAAFNAGWSARKYEEYKVRAAIDNVPIV